MSEKERSVAEMLIEYLTIYYSKGEEGLKKGSFQKFQPLGRFLSKRKK